MNNNERLEAIKKLMKKHSIIINDTDESLVNNYWDNDNETMLYNLEMDNEAEEI